MGFPDAKVIELKKEKLADECNKPEEIQHKYKKERLENSIRRHKKAMVYYNYATRPKKKAKHRFKSKKFKRRQRRVRERKYKQKGHKKKW
jgi:hypothetical protein